MATTETPVQLPELFCDSDSEARAFCTPYDTTFTTTFIENTATSTSYITITNSEQIYTSPALPELSRTGISSAQPPIGTRWDPPFPDGGPSPARHSASSLPLVLTLVVGVLLLASLIGLCIWIPRAKKKRAYPGHQVLSMLGRSGTNGSQGGGAAPATQSGNGGRAMERGLVSLTNASSASGGAASPASSSATVPAAVPVVGRIDGVLAGERSETGKASGGDGGVATYA